MNKEESMVPLGILVFLAASAGIWHWIVRNRGSVNLWLANLAGVLASFLVGVVVLIFMAPEQAGTRGPAYFLYSLMAFIGVFIGTWLFVIARFKEGEHPVGRHFIAGACSVVAAFFTLLLWVTTFPPK
jgi:hypothetical protein